MSFRQERRIQMKNKLLEEKESKEDLLLDGEYVPVAESGTAIEGDAEGEMLTAYVYMLMAAGKLYSFVITEKDIGDSLFKEYSLYGLFHGKVASWYLPLVSFKKPLKSGKYRNLEAAEVFLQDEVYNLVENFLVRKNVSLVSKMRRFSLVHKIESIFDANKMRKQLCKSSRKEFIENYLKDVGEEIAPEDARSFLDREFSKLFFFNKVLKKKKLRGTAANQLSFSFC